MEAPSETQPKDTKVNDAGKQPRRKGQKRKRPRKDDNQEDAEIMRKARKYDRMGKQDTNVRKIVDKKVVGKYNKARALQRTAAVAAARSELLLPSEPGHLESEDPLLKTKYFKQTEIVEAVDVQTAANRFDLNLEPFAPYKIDYSREGTYLLMGGKKGHLALLDWRKNKLLTEVHVKETVRDVKILNNYQIFAAAQKKHVYFYDHKGTETHRLKSHTDVNRLEFLPYHWLLVSISQAGWLKYQDTSTGELVYEHSTKLGNCDCMVQNPWNAVINLGHYNGTVTMWSPNLTTPLVKMLCHEGPVRSIACDKVGQYMATSGNDGHVKIWDLRTYKLLSDYYSFAPATSLSISQRGLLGVATGPHVTIWKDALRTKQTEPYMKHLVPGADIVDLHFTPFEDVMGIGHSKGVSSIIVPGSGEPNFDSFEANPYQTNKQLREATVHSLLEKLQPEMISLNPSVVGRVDDAPRSVIEKERREEDAKNAKPVKERNNRVKNQATRKYRKKQLNIVDSQKMERANEHVERKEMYAKQKKEQQEKEREAEKARGGAPASALDRFKPKQIGRAHV